VVLQDGGFHLLAVADMGECAIMNLALHPQVRQLLLLPPCLSQLPQELSPVRLARSFRPSVGASDRVWCGEQVPHHQVHQERVRAHN
jgi:hypothetical protein